MMKLLSTIIFMLFAVPATADTCDEWFNKSGVKRGKDCEQNCGLINTGMSTFMCPGRCSEFCKGTKPTPDPNPYSKSLLKSLIIYPGLTETEKKLVVENPKEAFIVFLQKNKAEDLTEKDFPEGLVDDESDAFRHFIWSGLLLKELGVERARVYLEAHEADPLENPASKAMDLANNKTAIAAASQLSTEGKLDIVNLERQALTYLKEHKLVVIKPQGFIPKEPTK
jgi:hypothetical protein